MKVSFVVIAKNESFTITRCINSIVKCGELLSDYEIILVDSLSTDGTLEKVLSDKNDKMQIFQITRNPNAARARNIGGFFKHKFISLFKNFSERFDLMFYRKAQ